MVEDYLQATGGRNEPGNQMAGRASRGLRGISDNVIQDTVQRASSYGRTKTSVEEFNRQERERIRLAKKQRDNAILGFALTAAGGAVGGIAATKALGLTAANFAEGAAKGIEWGQFASQFIGAAHESPAAAVLETGISSLIAHMPDIIDGITSGGYNEGALYEAWRSGLPRSAGLGKSGIPFTE